MTLKLTQMS